LKKLQSNTFIQEEVTVSDIVNHRLQGLKIFYQKKNIILSVIFQVLTAAREKMSAFWDIMPYSNDNGGRRYL
jgi:hypothetical protein